MRGCDVLVKEEVVVSLAYVKCGVVNGGDFFGSADALGDPIVDVAAASCVDLGCEDFADSVVVGVMVSVVGEVGPCWERRVAIFDACQPVNSWC